MARILGTVRQLFQIATTPIYKAEKPIRNPAYRRFVKRFACIGCGATRGIDPMHTGSHGLSQKGCDMKVLPGCRKCHDAFDADPRGFAARHHLNIPAQIRKFNRLWSLRQRRVA
jgi:hypothetical protein